MHDRNGVKFGRWWMMMKNFYILRNQRKYSPLFILWLAVDQCQCMLVRDNGLISTCSFCNLFFTITKFLVGALQPEDNCVFTSGDWICWVLHQPDQENVENYFLDLVILIIHQDTDGLGMKPTETIASLIVSRYRDKKIIIVRVWTMILIYTPEIQFMIRLFMIKRNN